MRVGEEWGGVEFLVEGTDFAALGFARFMPMDDFFCEGDDVDEDGVLRLRWLVVVVVIFVTGADAVVEVGCTVTGCVCG